MGEKRLFNSVWAGGALFLERREKSGPPCQLCSSSRALKEW